MSRFVNDSFFLVRPALIKFERKVLIKFSGSCTLMHFRFIPRRDFLLCHQFAFLPKQLPSRKVLWFAYFRCSAAFDGLAWNCAGAFKLNGFVYAGPFGIR